MEFEWDEKKAVLNYRKHKIKFEDAIHIFLRFTLEWEDNRHDYGESRFIALGTFDGRVVCCVYTDRGDVRRIISAWKADSHEQRTYYTALSRYAAQGEDGLDGV
ncbi:MAG: BrnT family toxin [Azospirillaceae bacterium]|nr:BrnT family toxin [Azospirillaceae bacterium]